MKNILRQSAVHPSSASKAIPSSVVAAIWLGCASLAFGTNRYVDPASPTPIAPYTTSGTAAHLISDALGTSSSGDVVSVAAGVYTLTSQLSVPAGVRLTSPAGPAGTTLNGNSVTRCVYMAGAGGILDGFTITGGKVQIGAGVYLVGSSLSNCVITGNQATGDAPEGGGVYADGSTISHCVISGNSATSTNANNYMAFASGGGIYATNQSQIDHTTVSNNSLTAYYANGAGINANNGSVQNCSVTGNTATGHWAAAGGGIYMTANTGGFIRTCLVAGNHATADRGAYTTNTGQGGGIYFNSGPAALESCTISGNGIDGDFTNGGGLFCGGGDQIKNTIISGNTAIAGNTVTGVEYYPNMYTAPTFDHCCTAPLPAGIGNTASAPGFMSGGYRLTAASPCVDAGTNQGWMTTATVPGRVSPHRR